MSNSQKSPAPKEKVSKFRPPKKLKQAMDMERALVLDTVRVTEQAAIAASRVAGKGDSDLVDQAGVDAMRRVLNELHIDGEIVTVRASVMKRRCST